MALHTSRGVEAQRRPLLGLRVKPGRLALVLFRLPLMAYRHGRGGVLGHTFLQVVHVGRRTGREHATVAMVLSFDPLTHRAVICSAWGPETDWVRNLRAHPAVRVDIGRETFVPQHRFLAKEESVAVAAEFRSRHPYRLRFLSWVLGWGDLRSDERLAAFVETHPFIALQPVTRP